MLSPTRLWRRVSSVLRSASRDAELEEELAFHIDRETQRLVEQGMDTDSAQQEARRRFGSVVQAREGARDARGVRLVDDLVRDTRIALRTYRTQPVYTAVAVLTLAIGIGATTAIFAAVYGVLLAPLPYESSDRIVTVVQTSNGQPVDGVAPANFLDWQERQRTFAAIAAAEPFSLDYVGPDGPERFSNSVVTREFFDVLRVNALLGRTLQPIDYEPTSTLSVVMSEELWRTRFGGDSAIIGRSLVLDSQPMVVVGVLPSAVDLPYREQLWTPKRQFRDDERLSRTSAYFTVLARLADHTQIEAAREDMRRVSAQLAAEYPATNAQIQADVVALRDALFSNSRESLWLLFGAVSFVLLIACSNVASLQLAQSLRRERELSVRVALGAGRARLIRQLLVESVLLAALGGALGIAVATLVLGLLRQVAPSGVPRIDQLSVDAPVLLFALAVSLLTAVAVGASPIREATRVFAHDLLAGGAGRHVTASRRRRRLQRHLVGSQVALAFVLLVGAGLLIRSLGALMQVPRGFETQGIVNVTLQAWGYYPTGAHRVTFVREATERLRALPGVEQAGITTALPLSIPIGAERTSVSMPGLDTARTTHTVRVAAVSPGYLETLRIPLQAGRVVGWDDNANTTPVVIVSEAFARRYWPGEVAVGKRFSFGFQGRPVERVVIGVVADVRHDGLDVDVAPALYVPHAQAPSGALQVVLRARGDLAAVQRAARAELQAMNGVMPLSEVTTLDARLGDSLRERRFHLSLLSAFAVTALLLAAVGVYGVMNQLTSERTREIGLRMALGARADEVVRLLLHQGMAIAGAGVAAGLLVSVAANQLLRGMLYSVRPLDVPTYAAVCVLLLLVALLATWIPARRGASVDPMQVLRLD